MNGFADKPPTSFGVEEVAGRFIAVIGHDGKFERVPFRTKEEAMAFLQRREKELSARR